MKRIFFHLSTCGLLMFFLLGSVTFAFAQCPSSAAVVLRTHTDISCFGANDGTLTVELGNGNAPLNFELIDLATGDMVTLAVTETNDPDGNGNFRKVTYSGLYESQFAVAVFKTGCPPIQVSDGPFGFDISEPDELQVNILAIDPDCNPAMGGANADGQIDISVSGGTAPYNVTWPTAPTPIGASVINTDPGSVSAPGIDGGLYVVNIEDNNGCEVTENLDVAISTVPDAGDDQNICVTTATLDGNNAGTAEEGEWTVVAGAGTFADPSDPDTQVTGLAIGTNTFRWTIRDLPPYECPGNSDEVSIVVNPTPVPTITGPSPVCVNSTGNIYTTEPGMTGYVWTVNGGTITAGTGTNSITVTWTSTTTPSVSVNYTDLNGCTALVPTTQAVVVNPAPVPTITGPSPVCLNSTGNVYTTEPGMSAYVWTVNGGTITSGVGTNSIQVTWTSTTSPSVSVNYTNLNGCTASTPTTQNIVVNPLPTPTITGPATACINSTGNIYSTEAGMTGYVWNVTGGTITAGAGTNSVTVTWTSTTTPQVSVSYTNANGCASATPTTFPVVVNTLPLPTITGPTVVCLNSTGIIYSTEGGMTGYVWTVNGGTITAGTGTNSITVNWTSTTTPSVSVTYSNAAGCAPATPTTQNVTVNALPTPTITGPTPVCVNSTGNVYSTEAGMSSYVWTVNGGTIISGAGTNSITVTWTSTTSPSVSVNYANAAGCSAGTPTTQNITVNPAPVPTISGPSPVCLNSTGNVYTTEAGMSGYTWTVNGGTITSGAGTNSITVTWTSSTSPSVSVNYSNGNGCSAASPTTRAIVVNPLPVPTITGPTAACINSTGNIYSTESGQSGYVWTINGGTITAGAGTNSVTVTWTSTTAPNLTVTYTSAAGCAASTPTTQNVTVNPVPVPTISGPTPVCLNSTSNTYTTEPGMTGYVWTVNGGTITAGAGTNSITVTWTSTTSPSVTVTYATPAGCSPASPTTQNIIVNTLPTPTITGPASACLNSTGNIYTTEAGMASYVWTINGGTITSGAGTNSITVTWTSTTSPSVSVTYNNASGCGPTSPTTQNVVVNPLPVPTITGPSVVCLNSSGIIYSTEAGMSGYVWTVNGGNITAGAGTNSITVTWTSTASPSVSVTYNNASGCAPASATTQNVTVNPLPTPTITGPTTACLNSTGNIYNTEAGMSGYVWTVTGGTITAGAGTNAVTVTWTSTASPSISVTYAGATGCSAATPTTQNIVIDPLPVPTITGPSPVCLNSTGNVYTTEVGMTGYVWTVNGGTITAGAGTNSITVTWTSSAAPNVTVTYATPSGCSPTTPTSLPVTVTNEPVPTITGPTTVCLNSTGNIYSTEAGMTGYVWSVTDGTITAGTGTNSITLTWTGSTSPSVSVNYVSPGGCTASTPTTQNVTVNPVTVPTITGPATVCNNSTGNIYSTEPGMTGYNWSITDGTITAGQGTNSITVSWTGTTAPSVAVSYTDAGGCTSALPTTLNVNVNPLPVPTITGPATACLNSPGNVYTTEAGMSDYSWTINGGTITTPGTNSITVTWTGTTAPSVSVSYRNAAGCLSAAATQFPVTVNPQPTPTITGPSTVCINSTGNTYTTEAGMTGYVWSVTDGTITAGLGTNSIEVTWTGTTSPSVSVNYTDANGCAATTPTTQPVTVDDIPVPTITGATTACVNSTGNIYTTESGMTGYIWTITDGTITAGAGTNAITVTWTGTTSPSLTVTFTNPTGCAPTTPTTQNITVNPTPDATITAAGPFCTNSAPVNLTAATPGGTWSGPGITDAALGTFDPSLAGGAGTKTITYSVTVGSCTSTATRNINVFGAPDASITPAGPFCTTDAPQNLTAATMGGTWSGDGITDPVLGTFDPGAAIVGTNNVSYSITVGSCTSTETITINVGGPPDATITAAGPFCTSDASVTLVAATAGGSWAGPGVNATTGEFNPATAGPGTHLITYTIAIGGCSDTDDLSIVVNASPDATITPAGPFCTTDAPTALTAATAGGTWSGDGITDPVLGTFDPASAIVGTNNVTYTITIGTCTDTETISITVAPPPDATITPVGPFCSADAPVTLNAATAGGTWSGPGVNATTGEFDPSTAGTGTHNITYTITIGGCNDSDVIAIVVNPSPVVTITPAGPFCTLDAPTTLTATPAGGTWAGGGITDPNLGTFDPSLAFVGNNNVTYTVTDGSCSTVATVGIMVATPPDATINAAGPFCTGDDPVVLTAATAGGTWSGPGIVDASTGMFDPFTAGPGSHSISYSITIGSCSDTDAITVDVNQSDDPTIDAAGPFCVTDAAVLLSAATPGGTWAGPGVDASGNFTPATAGVGTHTITYSFGGSCPQSDDIQITVGNPDATITAAGPFCTGDSPVTLIAATAGGTWSGPGVDPTTGEFTPSTAGTGTHTITYTVTIGGCTDTETTSITVNPGPDATITPSGPFCANTGSVTLVAATAGGTWSGPGVNAATGEFNPASAGAGVHVITYSVTVGSCTDTDTQNILVRPVSDPACGGGGGICDPAYTNALVSSFTRPTCTTQDDGSMTFTVAGGLANYFVELTGDNLVQQKVGSGPDFVFNNLSPDENYQFVVTDALGRTCAITHSLNVQPNVNATASTFVDATCAGGIGKATITVTGGSSPFEYFDGVTGWVEFISGNPVDLPSNGTYNVLVRDDASDLCPASVSVTVNAATPPIVFNVSDVTDVSTCGGEDGSFTVENVVGGAGTYQIRLVRETALGNEVVIDFEPLNQTNAHEYPAQLAAGSYIAVLQDLNGCTVNTNPVVIDGPGAIDFSVVKLRDTDCGADNMAKNGQAGILLTTSGSYQVGVSPSQFIEPSEYANLMYSVGDPNPTIDTLGRGTWFIFIKPATGSDCPSVRSVSIEGAYTISFGLQRICNPTGPSGLNLTDVVADPAGSNLTINIYASNDLSAPIDPVLVVPYNDVIAIDHPVLASPGDYFIEIQQTQALCMITSERILYTVSPAMTLVVEDIVASLPEPRSTGSFTLKTVIGGLPLNGDDGLYYEATLVDPATNSTIDGPFNVVRNPQGNYEYKFKNMPIGTYRLDVTDAYGCQASFVSIVPHNTDIIIPNIFTPNNDEVNDLFEIVNLPEGGKHKLVITNRWGKEMFTSSDYKTGTFWNAEDAPEGIYFYRLQVSGGKTYSGWVEILRGARP